MAYDSAGQILTASASPDEGPAAALRAAPRPGTEVGYFDVPAGLAGREFSDLVHLLKVDTAARQLIPADNEPSA